MRKNPLKDKAKKFLKDAYWTVIGLIFFVIMAFLLAAWELYLGV